LSATPSNTPKQVLGVESPADVDRALAGVEQVPVADMSVGACAMLTVTPGNST